MPARTASAIILAVTERRRAAASLVGSWRQPVHGLDPWARSLTAWGGSPKWPHSPEGAFLPFGGAVAQLGERLVRNEEVRGSTPLGSTSPLRRPPVSFAASTCSGRRESLVSG